MSGRYNATSYLRKSTSSLTTKTQGQQGRRPLEPDQMPALAIAEKLPGGAAGEDVDGPPVGARGPVGGPVQQGGAVVARRDPVRVGQGLRGQVAAVGVATHGRRRVVAPDVGHVAREVREAVDPVRRIGAGGGGDGRGGGGDIGHLRPV